MKNLGKELEELLEEGIQSEWRGDKSEVVTTSF